MQIERRSKRYILFTRTRYHFPHALEGEGGTAAIRITSERSEIHVIPVASCNGIYSQIDKSRSILD